MATTTITNTSNQIIPILVGSTTLAKAEVTSSIPATVGEQVAIAPDAQLIVETQRVDLGQLEQLRRKSLITFSTF